MWQLSRSQKEVKWQQSTLCKVKLKKCILYLILSVGMSLYQERYHIDCQQGLNAQQSLKPPSEMSETQWPHTLHISLNQEKPDVPVWAATTIFQILNVPVPKLDVPVFTG
jgi:hypothetical protein